MILLTTLEKTSIMTKSSRAASALAADFRQDEIFETQGIRGYHPPYPLLQISLLVFEITLKKRISPLVFEIWAEEGGNIEDDIL